MQSEKGKVEGGEPKPWQPLARELVRHRLFGDVILLEPADGPGHWRAIRVRDGAEFEVWTPLLVRSTAVLAKGVVIEGLRRNARPFYNLGALGRWGIKPMQN